MTAVSFHYGYDPDRGWSARCDGPAARAELERAFAERFPLKAWPEDLPVIGHFEVRGSWAVVYKPRERLEMVGVILPTADYRRRRLDPFSVLVDHHPTDDPPPPPIGALPERFAVPGWAGYLPYARSLLLATEPERRETTYWSLLPHGLSPRRSPLSRFAAGASVRWTEDQLRTAFTEGSPLGTVGSPPTGSPTAETDLLVGRLDRFEDRPEDHDGPGEEIPAQLTRRLEDLAQRVQALETLRRADAANVPVAAEPSTGRLTVGAGVLLVAVLLGAALALGWWAQTRSRTVEATGTQRTEKDPPEMDELRRELDALRAEHQELAGWRERLDERLAPLETRVDETRGRAGRTGRRAGRRRGGEAEP